MSLILQDTFWVVYIPLVCKVKFQYYAQFPVDIVIIIIIIIILFDFLTPM